MEAYTNNLYGKLQFDEPMKVESPPPDWPESYYTLVKEIKEVAEGYLAQREVFPDH